MATTPTSLINRLMNLEPCVDGLQDAKYGLVTVPAATTTLTLTPAAHAGNIVLVQSTGGLTVTPPAATGTGNIYTFYFLATISGGNFTFDAKAGNASDLMNGIHWAILSGGITQTAFPTAGNTNLITINGGTQGGLIGSWLQLIDFATHNWWVNYEAIQSGTSATCFSNH